MNTDDEVNDKNDTAKKKSKIQYEELHNSFVLAKFYIKLLTLSLLSYFFWKNNKRIIPS